MESIDDKIRVKHIQIQVENDPIKRNDLQKQLQKLQLNKEIEQIKIKIQQLR
jgi:hypothetical protein